VSKHKAWYWPLFPFWTSDGSVRPNLLLPAGWAQRGGQVEVRGPYWDRERVTYYRPRRQDIELAGSLFPGPLGLGLYAENPPWKQVYEELVSLGVHPHEIIHLKCYDALALLCDLRRRKQAEQLFIMNQAYWKAELDRQAIYRQATLLAIESAIKECLKENPELVLPLLEGKTTPPQPPNQTLQAEDVTTPKEDVSHSEVDTSPVAVNVETPTLNASTVSAQAAPVADSKVSAELASPTSEASESSLVKAPRKNCLSGWKAICRKLNLSQEDRRTLEAKVKWLKRLNRKYHGPIYCVGPGHPPIVEEQEIMDWWNTLPEKIRQKASPESKTQSLNSRNEMTL